MSYPAELVGRDGAYMNVKCCIFDFDGTLFDSMFLWEYCGENYLRSLGIEPRDGLQEVLRPMSLYRSACYLKETYSLPLTVEDIIQGINETVEEFYIHKVLPKAGVVAFLDRLHRAGISMSIATATERYQVQAALRRCGMEGYFAEIFTCGEVGYGKDVAVIYQKAMEYLGGNRGNTLVFEDALHAVSTAKTDEFQVVAVFDSSEKEQDSIKKLADHYISDYTHSEEIRALLRKWGIEI